MGVGQLGPLHNSCCVNGFGVVPMEVKVFVSALTFHQQG